MDPEHNKSLWGVVQAYKTYKLGGSASELLYSPATYGIDLSHKDMPRPRESLRCPKNC